jgi:hypothetical protein
MISASTLIPANSEFSPSQLAATADVGSIYLFQGAGRVLSTAMQEFIDRFAMQGQVRVIVGGNRISFEHLPLILGPRASEVYEIMDRIQVSRAETCYQMKDVLVSLEASRTPIVITDMLESFYEEDLALKEVSLLLTTCLDQIVKLSEHAPVLIGAQANPERPTLIAMLEQYSDQRFYFEPSSEIDQPIQEALL